MLSNVVMMGMGEPLFNTDNVIKALTIIMDGDGLSVSRRRITLSTSGVVPEIGRVGRELGVGLAISLHAVTDELRDVLVPINRKYPIEELLRACRDYPAASNARRITFEYVMLDGVNDSLAEAREMARAFEGHPGQDQPDPVQQVAGRHLRLHTRAQDQEILRDPERSRPVGAHPGTPRPGHPRRLRPTQIGKRAGPQGEGRGCRSYLLNRHAPLYAGHPGIPDTSDKACPPAGEAGPVGGGMPQDREIPTKPRS